MSDTGASHSEAHQSGAYADARDVHRAVPYRILFGAQAMHYMQSCVPDCRISALLQRHRKLLILGKL